MTHKEALEILYKGIAPNPTANNECIKLCKNALEKQIPKKPKVKEETYSRFYDCPSCGGYLVSKIDGELCSGQKYKYCHRCGQALDWSDSE